MEINGMFTSVNDFKVGDEVVNNLSPDYFVVTYVDPARKVICGFGNGGQTFMDTLPTKWRPTGKNYPEVRSLLAALRH